MLADGTYDVVVVDAEADAEAIHLELAVLAGPHKGEVVALRQPPTGGDPIDLLAVPGTLVVAEGRPQLTLER